MDWWAAGEQCAILVFPPLCNFHSMSVFCSNTKARPSSPVAEGPYWVGISPDSGISNINVHLRHLQQLLSSVCAWHGNREQWEQCYLSFSPKTFQKWGWEELCDYGWITQSEDQEVLCLGPCLSYTKWFLSDPSLSLSKMTSVTGFIIVFAADFEA